MSTTYNISEVAAKLGLSTKTLRRWEEAGKFRGGRTEGGQRRYSLGDIHILDAIKSGLINTHKELLTQEQVKEEFAIDQITLDDWENKGQILPLVTADGTYYPQKAVIAKLKSHLASNKPSPLVPTLPTLPTLPTQSSAPTLQPTHHLTSTPPFTLPHSSLSHQSLTHHDFWVLFLLNLLVTLTLILLYHLLTLPQ